jgi:hypothetical protein
MTADFRGEIPNVTGNGKDTSGVFARPPVICLAFLLAGLALEFAWPAASFPNLVQYLAGAALIALGVGIMAVALRLFRNPIYVSLIFVYAGIGTPQETSGSWG